MNLILNRNCNHFRRCCIILMLCWGICCWVQAGKVDTEKATKVAQNYAASKQKTRTNVHLKHAATNRKEHHGRIQRLATPRNEQDTVYYYVFDVNDGISGGFVIVAGDDAVRPVLGYSTKGRYDENNLPPNFAYWMDYLKQEIAYAQSQNLQQSETIRQEWEQYLSGAVKNATDAVGPLIQTKWNQYTPYNNRCPSYGGSRCVTGCGATAMAQIMNYHRHPARGIGQSNAYITRTLNISIPSVNFEINYDWANMRNVYPGSATAKQQDAVATLMYHCGVSVQMDYAQSSGAYTFDVPAALTEHFGYDKDIDLLRRGNYNNTSWENTIREQIDAGLPVFYTGYYLSAGEGHAFVCDGYDSNGMYHFNWGWGGMFDGFFVTTSLNPGTGGAGSGSGTYNEYQEIIIHIKPDPNVPSFEGEIGTTSCNETYTFSGGNGTSAKPYLIATAGQLAKLAELVNDGCSQYNDKCYKLVNDIDLSEYGANWNNGEGWIPIGYGNLNANLPFKGEFDGNNKKITGLYINTTDYCFGLFGYIVSAKVQNIGIEEAKIKGGGTIGGVVGLVEHNNIITNCYFTGTVYGLAAWIGGVAGCVLRNNSISNCHFIGTVNCINGPDHGSTGAVGGIVGLLGENSNLTNCYSNGTVYSNSNGAFIHAGGIVGEVVANGHLYNCYSTSEVTGKGSNSFVGGIAGQVYENCSVTNSYSTGAVSASNLYYSYAGGVAGVVNSSSKLTNCYSTGTVSSSGSIVDFVSGAVGGIAGLICDNGNNGGNSSVALNCAALNKSLKGIYNVGRVIGSNFDPHWGDGSPGTYWGNIAFCHMTNDGGAAFVGENTNDGRGGISKSLADLQSADGFPAGFTRTPWTYELGKLPGLFGETVEMPEHLRKLSVSPGPWDIVLDNTGSATVYPVSFVDDAEFCDQTFVFVFDGVDYTSWTFTCKDIGLNTVWIVAIDEENRRSQPKEIKITVSDRTTPVFDVVSGLDVVPDYGSSITVYPVEFVENVSDNCSSKDEITFMFVVDGEDHASLTFTCNDAGSHTVSIVAIDGNGNRSQPKEVTFTSSCRIVDFSVISGRDIPLDDEGRVTVYPVEFVANVSAFDGLTFWFELGSDRPSLTFTCNDTGSQTVLIVATDGKGNRSQPQEVKFTITDLTPPVFDVVHHHDVILNNTGSVTVNPLDVIANLSDNCSDKNEIVLLFVVNGADHKNLTFTCNDIGSSTVSIVAIDKNGNRSQPQEVTYTVSDSTPPVARCKPVTLFLDGIEKTTLTAIMLDNGSTDNCGIEIRQIKRTLDNDDQYFYSLDFDNDDLESSNGISIFVTLLVMDASGNEAICTSTIRLEQVYLFDLGNIPGIFTPNGDGFNDTWEIPKIVKYPEANIRIYNRAKRLMVELKGAQMPWDGRDRNGNLLESGYYLYQIELQRGGKAISGYVTILR